MFIKTNTQQYSIKTYSILNAAVYKISKRNKTIFLKPWTVCAIVYR
jgi:hypothetical protein